MTAKTIARRRLKSGPAIATMILSSAETGGSWARSTSVSSDVDATQRRRYLTIVLDGLRPAVPSPIPGRPLGFDDLERARRRRRPAS